MNQNAGKLFWPNTYKAIADFPQLDENMECDVCIIGSGSTGAFLAYHFAQHDLKTVLVERSNIGYGSSIASTGLLQYSNDKLFTSYIHSFGEEVAYNHLKNCYHAIAHYKYEILPKLDENPDFIERKSFYYASKQEDERVLEEEFKNLSSFKFPVHYWRAAKIKQHFPFQKNAALITEGDAEINPYKNIHLLYDYAVKHGVKIFQNTEIVGNRFDHKEATLYTKDKHFIRTKYVIYATGYEAQQAVVDSNARIVSSYAIATNSIEYFNGWSDNMLIWETARPYIYARTSIDQRIIIGGLDEGTIDRNKRESMLFHKRDLLLKILVDLFPELSGKIQAEYYWTGFLGETHNGLPMIKQHPNYENGYYLLPYGGNGTVYSMILSKILKDFILHGHHDDFSLYYKQ
ncbi:NAD(P)/FAD-dependent oxidoreductase [Cytobacillus horneckiae]|uniref:NAD(P)/FAD-dependent oxidoreductase n=1 Tax=Cytobacillus horneckiae TaxID=549687 RepID=UPI003D9A83AC